MKYTSPNAMASQIHKSDSSQKSQNILFPEKNSWYLSALLLESTAANQTSQDGNQKDVWNNFTCRPVYPRITICSTIHPKMLNKLEMKKLLHRLIFRTCINRNSLLQYIRNVNQQNLQTED